MTAEHVEAQDSNTTKENKKQERLEKRAERKERREARKEERMEEKAAKKEERAAQREEKAAQKEEKAQAKQEAKAQAKQEAKAEKAGQASTANQDATTEKAKVQKDAKAEETAKAKKSDQNVGSDAVGNAEASVEEEGSTLWMLILILIVGIVSFLKWLFARRCPKCKKMWGMKDIDETFMGHSKVKNEKDSNGVYRKVYYSNIKISRRCSHCGHTDYHIVERKGTNS